MNHTARPRRVQGHFSPRGASSTLVALALVVALLSSSCAGDNKDAGRNAANTNAPAATPAPQADVSRQQADGPFSLGDKTFGSRQEFVEAITPRCATVEPDEDTRRQLRVQVEQLIQRTSPDPEKRVIQEVNIPVHFHVITNSAGTEGAVSEETIRRQIDILNSSFNGTGPGGTGFRTPFRFTLADVETIRSDRFFNIAFQRVPSADEIELKRTHNKGGRNELNFYTARLADSTLGWARFPWDALNVDGVIVRFSTLPGGSTPFYNEGDTGTHEVGHWLGLFHTFQGGCSQLNDEVADTPAEGGPASRCPTGIDTCPGDPGADPVDNFMDYSDDNCMFKFTGGQSTRMSDMFTLHRR